ncbi:MAG TPA: BlaI/MecI/CopY family transcriptional regulator [Chthonomonadaceae bacterium]|nr:BlaI/MecI/CopY family transcriptional regulator [Chthonomonadaceae bacterium]
MAFTDPLSRRERQIMDILYQRGAATANQVLADLPDPPSSSAIRTLLRLLEEKGHIRHTQEGLRYIYAPTHPRQNVARQALTHVVKTFFGGNVTNVVTALVTESDAHFSQEELDHLAALIEQARAQEVDR